MLPLSACYRQDMWWAWHRTACAAAVACVIGSASVAANEICVTCVDPDASYRCRAEGTPLKPSDARLSLACITEIARRDGHQSCSADRRRTTCEGPVRTITATGYLLGEPPAAEREAAASPPQPPAEPRPGPPDTVAELAKRTADSSKQQLQKATDTVGDVAKKTGSAVGDAARKSWRCLSSLFFDC